MSRKSTASSPAERSNDATSDCVSARSTVTGCPCTKFKRTPATLSTEKPVTLRCRHRLTYSYTNTSETRSMMEPTMQCATKIPSV